MGIIFYELLTGVSPFPAGNDFARLTSVLTEEVKPIEAVAPQLASWGPFILRALAKDPAQRFQSADEMAAALVSAARGQPWPQSSSSGRSSSAPASAVTTAMEVQERPSAVSHAPLAFMTTSPLDPKDRGVPPGGYPSQAPPSSLVATSPMEVKERPSSIGPSPVSMGPGTMGAPPGAALKPPGMQPLSGYPAHDAGRASVAAVSHGSVPPPAPRLGTIASTPPPALASQIAGNTFASGPTHLSAQAVGPLGPVRPAPVEVIEPPVRRGAPYWVVGLVAVVAFGLGWALGFLMG